MKRNLLALTLVFIVVSTIILSCSKNGGSSSTGTCKLSGFVQGTDVKEDTTFTFQYDNNNRITSLFRKDVFSGNTEYDTIVNTYDASGNLIQTKDTR